MRTRRASVYGHGGFLCFLCENRWAQSVFRGWKPPGTPEKLYTSGAHRARPRFGPTLPVLEVVMRSLALRADRSVAIDVRAPVRIPGFWAGAVGGLLLPPPAGFATAPPPVKGPSANATTAAAVDAVSPDGAVAAGIWAAILWSRNPRSAPLTFEKQRRGKSLRSRGADDVGQMIQ